LARRGAGDVGGGSEARKRAQDNGMSNGHHEKLGPHSLGTWEELAAASVKSANSGVGPGD